MLEWLAGAHEVEVPHSPRVFVIVRIERSVVFSVGSSDKKQRDDGGQSVLLNAFPKYLGCRRACFDGQDMSLVADFPGGEEAIVANIRSDIEKRFAWPKFRADEGRRNWLVGAGIQQNLLDVAPEIARDTETAHMARRDSFNRSSELALRDFDDAESAPPRRDIDNKQADDPRGGLKRESGSSLDGS